MSNEKFHGSNYSLQICKTSVLIVLEDVFLSLLLTPKDTTSSCQQGIAF